MQGYSTKHYVDCMYATYKETEMARAGEDYIFKQVMWVYIDYGATLNMRVDAPA